jgi:hypothetical protein
VFISHNIECLITAKIELEFDSKLDDTQHILEKISQVVKYAEEKGLHLRELELESESDDEEEDG